VAEEEAYQQEGNQCSHLEFGQSKHLSGGRRPPSYHRCRLIVGRWGAYSECIHGRYLTWCRRDLCLRLRKRETVVGHPSVDMEV